MLWNSPSARLAGYCTVLWPILNWMSTIKVTFLSPIRFGFLFNPAKQFSHLSRFFSKYFIHSCLVIIHSILDAHFYIYIYDYQDIYVYIFMFTFGSLHSLRPPHIIAIFGHISLKRNLNTTNISLLSVNNYIV